MPDLYALYQQPVKLWIYVIIFAVWSLFWKGIALYYAARKKQKGWFFFLLILNTVGVLPILYLLFFKPKKEKLVIGKPKKEETKVTSVKSADKKKN